jgi:arylsulfatase A-like enzyme
VRAKGDRLHRGTCGRGRWTVLVLFGQPLRPHHPFDPAPEYLERYQGRLDAIPLPSYVPGELDGKPEAQRIDHRGAYGIANYYPFADMSANDHRLVRAAYWAMCDQIDEQVGRMMEALDRSGQREQTLIVFMSDHGEMLGDHGLYLKGPYFYEQAVHIPLIIAGPGVATRRIGGLVELVDLAPTLLEAAGLPKHPGMQGRPLWPLLTGKTTEGSEPSQREDVYCEISTSRGGHPVVCNDGARPALQDRRPSRLRARRALRFDGGSERDLQPLARSDLRIDPNRAAAAHVRPHR